MALELLIARHAKSSWSNSSLSDHDRPLNKRGLRDAPRMAAWLSEQKLVPDIVLTSSANRAQTTAEIYCEQWSDTAIQPQVIESFYLAHPTTYLEEAAQLGAEFERLLVVGHNPGLEGLVEILTGENEIMPTAAVAHVRFAADNWSEVGTTAAKAELVGVFRPKEVLNLE